MSKWVLSWLITTNGFLDGNVSQVKLEAEAVERKKRDEEEEVAKMQVSLVVNR